MDPDDDQVEAEVRWAVRAGDVEDEFLGAKAQQNWQGISLWTGGGRHSFRGWKNALPGTVVMTLRLIESNEALQAELVASRKSAGKLAGDQISAHAVVRKATGQLRHTRSPIKSTAASPVMSSDRSCAPTERRAENRTYWSYLQYIKALG